ncbi:hypothetical protein [uncultured Corynebacterium sp.]|uniref:hypothetical protein n=1 Tax=uncultured Corynebacterium sp. TaxID=159447 RepID=UPI0025D33ADB|nr:hypothetical protein [uncultured Corynebacterium sp.]
MTNYFLFSAVSFDDYLAEIGEPTGFRSSDSLAGSFSGFFLDYLRPVPDDLDGDPLQSLQLYRNVILDETSLQPEDCFLSENTRLLMVTVKDDLPEADAVAATLQTYAAHLPLCLIDDKRNVLVNATGPFTGLQVRTSRGTIHTSGTEAVLHGLVLDDRIRSEDERDRMPQIIIDRTFWSEAVFTEGVAPAGIEGVIYVQAALLPQGWLVEHRTPDYHLQLPEPLTRQDMLSILAAFTYRDEDAFYARPWRVTEELDGRGMKKQS